MRKKIVAGNWKMNNDLAQTETFLVDLKKQVFPEDVTVMIAPPFTNLSHAFTSMREHPVSIAAQNMHQSEEGAFTGEVSAKMLKSVGVSTVILGHSERRAYFNEDSQLLAEKVNTALKNEMTVIFCIGEELEDRKSRNHFNLVKNQLTEGLFHVSSGAWENIIIAYEPVWAIGTGKVATSAQAQEVHQHIRAWLAAQNKVVADKVQILYGGSVKAASAKELFSQPDIDGGLVGGAALIIEEFIGIIEGAK